MASGTGKDSACYPLVPFSNRIANGQLLFGDEEIHVPLNWPGVRHPMHGDGWAHAWTVGRHDGSVGRARFMSTMAVRDGRSAIAPARPSCSTKTGLVAGMSIENLEDRDVPAGLGLHPYFPRDAETEIDLPAARRLGDRCRGPAAETCAGASGVGFLQGRRVEGLGLDHCFDGWDGRATIAWPRRGMRLDSLPRRLFRHLVIYVPDGQTFFCVEPVSHANGAVGKTLLAAGATFAGEIAFRLSFS